MLNRVVLIGRLTRDPEMKYTPQGVPVATLGIAVQRFTKNETGDHDVDFFNVTAWRRTAEFAQNYLTKGRLVSVDGRLQTHSWVDQASGQKRTAFEIVADNIDSVDRKPDGESTPGEAGAEQPPAPARAAAARPASNAPDMDESDPFADE
jgi:single-strand DNA-binding protein